VPLAAAVLVVAVIMAGAGARRPGRTRV
jgi:hypothetical protein